MRLQHVAIHGFRGFCERIDLPIQTDLTVFVGRNDAGKSSCLEAIDYFFSAAKLTRDDWAVGYEGEISITASFDDLPDQILLDAARRTTLAEEYLLDREGRLTVKRTWSAPGASPKSYIVCEHPDLPKPLLTSKIDALRSAAKEAGLTGGSIDGRVSSEIRKALLADARLRGVDLVTRELPLSAEDGKLMAEQLQREFPRFHLFASDRSANTSDRLAQDPTKLIIGTVLDRHTAQLEQLRAQVSSEIEAMLGNVLAKLEEIDPALATALTPEIADPSWSKAFAATQFKDENSVPLERRGTGVRRLVLMSFFRAEAEAIDDDFATGSILAIEEPETALHPDLQRQVLASLQEISRRRGRQIIFTTHSSNLLQFVDISSVRYLEATPSGRTVHVGSNLNQTEVIAHINASLGMLTDHGVRCFLLVEGARDIESLLSLADSLHSRSVEGVADLRAAEADGRLRLLPIGGCGAIALWETNLGPLGRFEMHLLDSDRTSSGDPLKPQVAAAVANSSSMRRAHALQLRELENYLSEAAIHSAFAHLDGFEQKFAEMVGGQALDYLDIPALCAEAAWLIHSATLPVDDRVEYSSLSMKQRDEREGKAKKRLAKCFGHETVLEDGHGKPGDLLEVLQTVSSKLS